MKNNLHFIQTYRILKSINIFVHRILRIPVFRQLINQFHDPTTIIEALQTVNISYSTSNVSTELIVNLTKVDTDFTTTSVYQFAHRVWNDPFWLASILILITTTTFIVKQHGYLGSHLLGSRMRASCCSLVYRKVNSIKYFIFILHD